MHATSSLLMFWYNIIDLLERPQTKNSKWFTIEGMTETLLSFVPFLIKYNEVLYKEQLCI